MSMSKIFTEAEILQEAIPIPDKIHGGFKNYLNSTVGRLTVRYYLGKLKSNKHTWGAECSCGRGFIKITSTGLCTSLSCGCYCSEQTSKANKGNKVGEANKKTTQTVEKIVAIKPSYEIVDYKDGKVMTKWDFFCSSCGETFSARPDNILPRKSGGLQTPCNCQPKGGYDPYKPGTLYLLTVDNYCKFGISNNFDKRYKQLSRSYGKSLVIDFLLQIDDGRLVANIEKSLKEKFDYTTDVGRVDGRTEYRFLSDKYEIIRNIIKDWTISI